MRISIVLLVLFLPLATHAAEPLGRLFFSPEQRVQLDALRTKKVVAAQVKDEPAPEIVTYKGIVRRSDGKATVWVNSKTLTEAELSTDESVTGRITRDGQIMLGSPTAGPGKMQLKVGQSAELLSGRVGESYSVLQNTTQTPADKLKPEIKPSPAAVAAQSGDTAARGTRGNTDSALPTPLGQAPVQRP